MNVRNALLLGFLAAVGGGCAAKEPELTPEMLQAKFAWDLGPDKIDIYAYPDEQKLGYSLFKERCSRCHTLARAINAPFASRENWTEYVKKMHKKSGEVLLGPKEQEKVIDFLVFDGRQRKTTPEFQAEGKTLEALFERVKKARDAPAAPKTQ